MFERFTDRARRVVSLAKEEARAENREFIGTGHFLIALVAEGEAVAAIALRNLGLADLDAVRVKVAARSDIPTSPSPVGADPPFTPRFKKVLELSLREALQLGHNYIGTEHLILALIREGQGCAAQVLVNDFNMDLLKIRQEVMALLAGYQTTIATEHKPKAVEATMKSIPVEAAEMIFNRRARALELAIKANPAANQQELFAQAESFDQFIKGGVEA